MCFGDADARSEIGRFDEQREAELGRQRRHDRALVALPVALQYHFVVTGRQPLCREHQLHRRLVHSDRGRKDARADVGNVGQLQQALYRSVLTIRAVKNRKHDVEVETGNAVRPAAVDRQQRLAAGVCDEVGFALGANGFDCAVRDHVSRLHLGRCSIG